MKTLPKTRTEQILAVMPILAWVACIGFIIESGGILYSYGISLIDPDAAKNLYRGLNLFNLRKLSFWYYTLSVSFLLALALMKAWVAYLVASMLSKFNMANPFTMDMAKKLEKVGVISFGTWVVTMLYNAHTSWLVKLTGELHGHWLSGEFIFMVGIVYIVSQVFKRGVEIQSENELTV